MKKSIFILILVGFVFAGCTSSEESISKSESNTSEVDTSGDVETITFGDSITTDGDAVIEDNTVTLTKGGSYKLTGSSDDAQVIINAPEEDLNITLDNLTLTSATTSAITGIDANNINLILSGESTLADTENNTDDYQAPLYVDEIEMHISGDGILNLDGNYQEGLESNNDLYIDGGTLNITSEDDGINTGDLLSINDGVVNVNSNGDGLDSNGDLEITGGEMYVSGGNNGNGPIDYGEGYTFTMTGGTIIGVGGPMASTPSTTEGQTFLTATASGTKVSTADHTYEAPKEFSYVFISYDGLTEDTEVQVDGTAVETSQTVSTGMAGGGGRGGMGEMPQGMGEMPQGIEAATN